MAFVYGHRYALEREQLAAGPWLRGTRPLENPDIHSILVRPQYQEEFLTPFVFTLGRFTGGIAMSADPAVYTVTAVDATLSYSVAGGLFLIAEPATYTVTLADATLQPPGIWIDITKVSQQWSAISADTSLWVDIAKGTNSWTDV